jgi:hypothetical protein
MAKIKNNFLKATVNKDFDERLTPNGQMTDAENVMVISEDNGGVGVLKNVKGNLKVTSLNIANSETIGSIEDDAKNRAFYFVASPSYDYVIQYNIIDNTTEIVLQSTHGTGVLNFDNEYRISHSDLFVSVEGYDLLSWTDGLNPPRIINIERAKTYGIDGFTEDEVSVMKPSPIYAPIITLQSTVTTELTNFLEDKFLQFAYRYKYEDGYYSAISSWSQVAFLPSSFALDYQTYENLGMVNLANTVNISFNCGNRHVIGIDLLFKESESSTVYIIDKFIKSEEGWNIPNQSITYNFYGNKIYGVLEESQYFRNFDNVPLKAKAQSAIGNRLVYGNITEGRDIPEPVKLNVDYFSSSLVIDEKEGIVSDVVKSTTYSNVVDFEFGTPEGGSAPVDEIDYETNTIIVDRTTDFPSATNIDLILKVSPKGVYFGSTYSVYVKDGSTTLFSTIDVSGEENITYTMPISLATIYNLKLYVVSDDGMIYDLDLEYNAYYVVGPKIYVSKYKYYAYDQLCYPKDGGYDSTLAGDTIIDYSASFDFTDFEFVSGIQMRFDFELQSSLVYEVQPAFTYFYNLTDSYTDLNDFMTNSGFVLDFEGTFSSAFYDPLNPNSKASNAGDIVSVQPFVTSVSGDILTITMPYVKYFVTEESTWQENKDDFYLINSLNFGLYSEDAFASMHSNRNYTCDVIYLDDKGRKTTVISGGETSVYIPASESERVNSIRVTTASNPPSWAKYYKFAIKETKREYDTIYGNVVYEDGIYRWIQLVGENKNKIKEGDVLELKSDYSGPTEIPIQIKVLEVATQLKDFLPDNETSGGDPILESSGLYFKIKQGAFDINIDGDTFVTYEGFRSQRYMRGDEVYTAPLFGEFDDSTVPVFIPTPVKNGSQIRFFVRMYMFKNGAFDQQVEIIKFAEDDYDSIREWWEAEIADNQAWLNFAEDRLQDFGWDENKRFYVASNRDGTARSNVRLNVVFDVKFSSGTLIFENYKEEQLNAPYFESVETYNVVGGNHFSGNALAPNVHILKKTFNCFTFGNGCESNTIKDSFNGKRFYINSNPTSITEDIYRQVNRYADLTYSGVYQESTGVNKLNEFNLSLANYKDDLVKKYGSIIRLDSDQTDLLVIQEDKWSKVLYGKDLLYNTDATTNLSRIEDVLGQQVLYAGEYGISSHPESYDDYGTNAFCTDDKRGVVLGMNNSNGLSEISNSGMRDYFKTLFRDNEIVNVIGQYDAFFDIYIMNIKYKIKGKDYTSLPVKYDYVTWSYSPEVNGFLGRQSFDPDSMLRVNNEFLSFKGADVYKHNVGSYNNFYGTLGQSTFAFNFNEEPSTRKIFKNISIEGNSAWNVEVSTDMQNGYAYSSDFLNKENVYYSYIRGLDSLDLKTLSVTGLGVIQNIIGSDYFLSEVPSSVSVGDKIYNTNRNLFGTVSGIGPDYISITPEPFITFIVNIGDFILSSKPSSIETSGIRGYYMNTRFNLQTTGYAEVYAINSEVAKSFE